MVRSWRLCHWIPTKMPQKQEQKRSQHKKKQTINTANENSQLMLWDAQFLQTWQVLSANSWAALMHLRWMQIPRTKIQKLLWIKRLQNLNFNILPWYLCRDVVIIIRWVSAFPICIPCCIVVLWCCSFFMGWSVDFWSCVSRTLVTNLALLVCQIIRELSKLFLALPTNVNIRLFIC